MRYLKAVLIALDQMANAIMGGFTDETISSRAWRLHVKGRAHWPARIINWLFHDRRHCYEAWLSEVNGSQLPPSIREARRHAKQN